MVFEPKISIVIPVYNGANYLGEAVDSALGQTYKSVEIIVVNDGSNDGGETEKIAKSYGSRIRYFIKENGGVASALNFGIKRMTGEYFSWLSHDDVYYPSKLERQVEFLIGLEKKHVVLYGDFELVDGQSRTLGVCRLERKITESPLRAILSGCIHGCSTLVGKKVIDAVGLFSERLRTTQDFDMWLRIYENGFPILHIPEVQIKSRLHPEQGQRKLSSVHENEKRMVYSRAFERLGDEIVRDAAMIFESLALKGVNLPVSVFRKAGKRGAGIGLGKVARYKAKVYLYKVARKMKRKGSFRLFIK
jgi:glycosyltransferase involved in cell wall biosynthesis